MPLKGRSMRTNMTQFRILQRACHYLKHCLKTVLRHIIAVLRRIIAQVVGGGGGWLVADNTICPESLY